VSWFGVVWSGLVGVWEPQIFFSRAREWRGVVGLFFRPQDHRILVLF
jgi:hypothetical protein